MLLFVSGGPNLLPELEGSWYLANHGYLPRGNAGSLWLNTTVSSGGI